MIGNVPARTHLVSVLCAAVLPMVLPVSCLSGQVVSGTTPTGIFYEVSGSGPPVVLIHAFSVDRRMWASQIPELEHRFRVVRYDLRGHGRSVAPTEPYKGYNDLRDVLDELGITRASLIGLSAGAEVAINFAIEYPERTGSIVLAAPGLSGYRVPPLPWMSPVLEAAAAGRPERAAQLWAQTPIMELRVNASAAATLATLVADNSRLWGYRRTEQPLLPPAAERLSQITAPTLVIIGNADLPHIQEIAQLLAGKITNAELVTIPGAGHMVNLDTPELFNRSLGNFLTRRRPTEGLPARIKEQAPRN